MVVEIRRSIQGELNGKKFQIFFLQRFSHFMDSLIRIPTVCRHVDLPNLIMLNKAPANVREFFSEKRLTAGQIQILNLTEGIGKGKYFVLGQVVPAV